MAITVIPLVQTHMEHHPHSCYILYLADYILYAAPSRVYTATPYLYKPTKDSSTHSHRVPSLQHALLRHLPHNHISQLAWQPDNYKTHYTTHKGTKQIKYQWTSNQPFRFTTFTTFGHYLLAFGVSFCFVLCIICVASVGDVLASLWW